MRLVIKMCIENDAVFVFLVVSSPIETEKLKCHVTFTSMGRTLSHKNKQNRALWKWRNWLYLGRKPHPLFKPLSVREEEIRRRRWRNHAVRSCAVPIDELQQQELDWLVVGSLHPSASGSRSKCRGAPFFCSTQVYRRKCNQPGIN